MYHAETDTPALARTSNLNEELGQVIRYLSIACAHLCSGDASLLGQDWDPHQEHYAVQNMLNWRISVPRKVSCVYDV